MPRPDVHPSLAEVVTEQLDEERQMRRVLELVARLPRREQEVFALCAWSDLSYENAAVALDLPVGTVRSRLSRARARLRELDATVGHEEDGHERPAEALDR
jgi:RNA polymerase sigma factor (sigma-70 family)